MTALVLTFAELAFLLGEDERTRGRLGLDGAEPTEDLISCGIASLYARGLLRRDAGRLVADEEIAALTLTLRDASTWVEIGLAREDSATGAQVFDTTTARAQVNPGLLGTFTFAPLDTAQSLPVTVSDYVAAFLREEAPGAVFVKATPRADEAPDEAFAIRRVDSSTVEIARGDAERPDVSESSLEDALAELRRYLEPA